MKKNLLDLSGKIDSFTVELFETIARVAESMSVPFFVVGATARDMILTYGYGISTIRATYDIDIGVQVSDWDQYGRLTEGLVATGKFGHEKKESQRLLYEEKMAIDVVPFGTIAGQDKWFSWPPDHAIKMSTLGFDEAYQNSIPVRLRSDRVLDIHFISLGGLALLKIISWDDNYPSRKRDAKDLSLIMRKYLEAGNEDRLFREEGDLVGEDFDYERASARLLGRDISAISCRKAIEVVLKILNQETGDQTRYRLVEDMMGTIGTSDDFETNLQLLEDLKSGILDRVNAESIK